MKMPEEIECKNCGRVSDPEPTTQNEGRDWEVHCSWCGISIEKDDEVVVKQGETST